MSTHRQRLIGRALCGAGGLVLLFGSWMIGAYVWGVLDVLDEADQSWMFWGLALLFMGLAVAGGGIGMIAAGIAKVRRVPRD